MILAFETDPMPAEVQILSCRYVSPCRPRRFLAEAALIARYLDGGGVFLRQHELCEPYTRRLIAGDVVRGIVANDYR